MSVDWKTFDMYSKSGFSIYIEKPDGTILDIKKFPIHHNKIELEEYYQKTINTYLMDVDYQGAGLSFVTPANEYIQCSFIDFIKKRK
jgi:hypothetical protein